jgi:SAM-dependent methyltransferase
MATNLPIRDQSELSRSASEARKTVLKPIQTARYLRPPANTPFPLEYSFYLLGDATGRRVLDLGCGSGEELIPLVHRGASVIGIDISPDLIALAERRLREQGVKAEVRVGSAYDTELPNSSVDVIFCMSLIHHLDLPRVKREMLRILRPDGFIVLKEPIRFNRSYDFLRSLLPNQEDISDDEHPLTKDEFLAFQEGFKSHGMRFFRLPFVPLAERIVPATYRAAFRVSDFLLTNLPAISCFATVAVVRLQPGVAR